MWHVSLWVIDQKEHTYSQSKWDLLAHCDERDCKPSGQWGISVKGYHKTFITEFELELDDLGESLRKQGLALYWILLEAGVIL